MQKLVIIRTVSKDVQKEFSRKLFYETNSTHRYAIEEFKTIEKLRRAYPKQLPTDAIVILGDVTPSISNECIFAFFNKENKQNTIICTTNDAFAELAKGAGFENFADFISSQNPQYSSSDKNSLIGWIKYISDKLHQRSQEKEEPCFHRSSSRILTHRGVYCKDCGKRF